MMGTVKIRYKIFAYEIIFNFYHSVRFPRLKIDSLKAPAAYHLINRVVGGQWLLGDIEKEILRRHIWATAAYCGLKILTYAVMSNHYHVLVQVPLRRHVSDDELLRRYRAFHQRFSGQKQQRLKEIEKDMTTNGPLAQQWRERQLRQMFDISRFGALLDQRFSIWYNRSNNRKGTLWMGRFKSVLVEDGVALRNMALYIDLNASRAGIVIDPKDYRFCGYAEATAGMSLAREGLQEIFQTDWQHAAGCYRAHLLVLLHKLASSQDESKTAQPKFSSESGEHSAPLRLGWRIRYFVDGVILGSAAYVRSMASLLPGERKRPPRPLDPLDLTVGLHVMGRLLRSEPAHA